MYKELEFKSWLAEILKEAPQQQDAEAKYKNYTFIDTEAILNEWVLRLKSATLVVIDTETTSLDCMRADLVGISIAIPKADHAEKHFAENRAAYIPLGHDYEGAPPSSATNWSRKRRFAKS